MSDHFNTSQPGLSNSEAADYLLSRASVEAARLVPHYAVKPHTARLLLEAAARVHEGDDDETMPRAARALHDLLPGAMPAGPEELADRGAELRRIVRDLAAVMLIPLAELREMEAHGAPQGRDWRDMIYEVEELAEPERPDTYSLDLSQFQHAERVA